jgi:hypothetical protein
MPYERMLDKSRPPELAEMVSIIGQPAGDCWNALIRFIEVAYAITPELNFAGKNYGWELRCRKGGRPLCDLYPENGAFTALVVLGAKEAAEALACQDTFGPSVRGCLESTPAYHDGRWLWIRVQELRDVEDIQKLLLIKRKPAQKKLAAAQ